MNRSLLFAVIVCMLGTATAAHAEQRLVHSERSLYREVLVYETGDVRCMCFTRNCRVGRQSCIDTRHPDRIVMNYPKMMLGALFVNPRPQSVLIVGLGGGTLPRALRQLLPDTRIDVVEIDPAVERVASRYFGFATSEKTQVGALHLKVMAVSASRCLYRRHPS